MPRFTSASVSITSAEPAGEGIARDEVLAVIGPQPSMIATASTVVRLTGYPPTQYFVVRDRAVRAQVLDVAVIAPVACPNRPQQRRVGRASQAVDEFGKAPTKQITSF